MQFWRTTGMHELKIQLWMHSYYIIGNYEYNFADMHVNIPFQQLYVYMYPSYI